MDPLRSFRIIQWPTTKRTFCWWLSYCQQLLVFPIFFLTSRMVRPEPFWYNKVQIVLHDLIKAADKKHGDMFEEPLPCHLISRRGKKFALTTAPNTGGILYRVCLGVRLGWEQKSGYDWRRSPAGGKSIIRRPPLPLRGQFSCHETTGLLATKLSLLGCKVTRDSARESNISKLLFCEETTSVFYKETDTSIEMSWNKWERFKGSSPCPGQVSLSFFSSKLQSNKESNYSQVTSHYNLTTCIFRPGHC